MAAKKPYVRTRKMRWGLEPDDPLVEKVSRREKLTPKEIRSIDELELARTIIGVMHQWNWGRIL